MRRQSIDWLRALAVAGIGAALGLAGCRDLDGDGDGPADAGPPDAAPEPDAYQWPDAMPEPHCSDGLDNDGDGAIDWPFDPGCGLAEDMDESDDCPDGPDCPACSNDVDDDGDGLIDEEDAGCLFASDDDEFGGGHPFCGSADPLVFINPGELASGTIVAGPNELQSEVCGGAGPELPFMYPVLSGPVTLTISTDHPGTTVDTVVYARTICENAATEMGCDDDGAGQTGGPSVLTIHGVGAGIVYILVDTYSLGSLGDFVLTVTEIPE